MSRKLLISTLVNETRLENDELFIGTERLDYVWIQGTVVETRYDAEEFTLQDESGRVVVALEESDLRLKDIPTDTDEDNHDGSDEGVRGLRTGQYAMVRGVVLAGEDSVTGEQVVLVEPRLVVVFPETERESLQRLWPIEVQECWSKS